MSYRLRIGIVVLVFLNLTLATGIWYTLTYKRTQPGTIATPPQTTALSTNCRVALDLYIDQSNQRVYDYFDIYNSINKIATETLVARIDTLSKHADPLPEGCPDSMQAALHANYVSVYMSAPIHLHMIVTKTNTDGSLTGVARQALRLFEREIDVAERTNYELLRLAE